jgi:hypothetical protein
MANRAPVFVLDKVAVTPVMVFKATKRVQTLPNRDATVKTSQRRRSD